jgi:extracellular factor (EF) 3-hydroxypalmitic acid methyl ester biosynthesis protein
LPGPLDVLRDVFVSDSFINDTGQNMRNIASHAHDKIAGMHTRVGDREHGQASAEKQLDTAIADFNQAVKSIEAQCEAPGADMHRLAEDLRGQLLRVETFCRDMEQQLGDDHEAIKKKQTEFRQRTDESFAKSFFMRRARTWPQGYPGDFEIIEKAYNNQTVSQGLGQLFDQYFLSTTLASGIRYRRALMREILAEEMRGRRAARILNIGCGPCRELVELAPVIQETGARFTCVDFDTEALVYSAHRVLSCGLRDHVEFRQYNALRMVNAERNIREFGHFDVIYTIGLLDYLTDDVLIRMIKSLYDTLHPGGVFIAVFKDCDRYDTIDYHWLVDWSGFLQRTRQDSWRLIESAGIPRDAVTIQRSQDDVMIFYRILRRAAVAHGAPAQGPHDRRDRKTEPAPRRPNERPKRETPSERQHR